MQRRVSRKRPPDAELKQSSGGLARVCACALLLGLAVRTADAQLIRGTVRTQLSEAVVAGARVSAHDSAGVELAMATSDAAGRFRLVLKTQAPFTLSVRKVGWMPSSSDPISAAQTDTIDFDMLVPSDPTRLSAIEVTAEADKSFNTRSFEEAKRHGWKVYAPALVAQHRGNATSFTALMREVGVSGVQIDDRADARHCLRSVRLNRCLMYIVDGIPSGSYIYVDPRDIYFFAVLSSSESASRWGDKAPWGAIVIYTRMNGDKKTP